MKILFIAGQAISSNSSVTMMNLAYIQGLVDSGNNVKIVTSSLPSNHVSKDEGIVAPEEVEIEEYQSSASYNVLSTKKTNNKKLIKMLKKYLRELYYKVSIYDSQKGWVENYKKFNDENYYDLIISSSDPKHSHLFAKKLIIANKIKYGKWVQIWGDPMYLDINNRNFIFKNRLLREEEKLISMADKILYVSPFTAEQQKKIFPHYSNKIDYILIPYYFRDETAPKHTSGDEMIFSYFGDYNSRIRNILPLYNAALETNMNLIIRGNSDKPLQSTNKISVDKRISIKDLKKLEEKTDVYIHLSNLSGTQIPAKLYYYSGTKKPILFILDGDSKRLKEFYEPFGRYIFVENNKDDIIREVNKIRSGYYNFTNITIPEKLSPLKIANELIAKSYTIK